MKRAVWRHIRSERSPVTTPQEYSALAKQLCSNVQVEYIAKSVIDPQSAFLDVIWEGVMAVPKTYRVYCFQASGADEVNVADMSNEMRNVSEFVEFTTPMSPLLRPIQQLNKILHLKTMSNLSCHH